jgi:hypothetical protein
MSTTALGVKVTGRIEPLLANEAVAALRNNGGGNPASLESRIIAPDRARLWAGRAVSPAPERTTDLPVLIDYYRAFNLVAYRESVYAVPVSAGALDLTKDADRSRAEVLRATSLEDARAQIDRSRPVLQQPAEDDPLLTHEGYRGFKIVWWTGRYYAIPQGEGAFEPERFEHRGYSRSFQSSSEPAMLRLIDRDTWWRRWRALVRWPRRVTRALHS